ncbi:MAG: homoserine dehydrogenase [Nitrospiraceae bacterium]|nr:homoserine dehydrogenase [Nitrospiraceae bacterium]
MKQRIGIGIIGFGTVGCGVVKILIDQAELIRRRVGIPLEIVGIADQDITSDRGIALDRGILTTDVKRLIDNPQTDIVVELIGGLEPAKQFIVAALTKGKPLVTANKALLAVHGEEIYATAQQYGVDIGFEASVGGGMPIIRTLREGLAGEKVHTIYGIINGTANYILTKMNEEEVPFQEVVAEAQRAGFAEADPSTDIEGLDSAHKLAILINLAFGTPVNLGDVYTEGVTSITSLDLEAAREFGYTIKLLGIAKWSCGDARLPQGQIEARVHPTMIPNHSPLAQVNGVFNAIHLVGESVGDIMVYGRGAGSLPTGSAVVGDLIDIARNLVTKACVRVPHCSFQPDAREMLRLKPMAELCCAYYLRFTVQDTPGILSQLAGILGDHDISIASVLQRGRERGGKVPVVMITHEATEHNIQAAIQKIEGNLSERTMIIRIESQ